MRDPWLDALAAAVWEDAAASRRHLADVAANEGRALVEAAEAHVEELERAARELGDVRGRAASDALEHEADAEIEGVLAGAFDRLFERFLLRVQTALDGARDTPLYPRALEAWARQARAAMDGPTDVFAAREDRLAVYDALLAAGAQDFQVHGDPNVRTGFVVRDLDGRTVVDRRPQALVAEHADALRRLLAERVPPPPDRS